MVLSAIEDLYSIVFSQEHSQDHGIILAGNNQGNLMVFNVSSLLHSEDNVKTKSDNLNGPIATIKTHSQGVYSIASTDTVAITGNNGQFQLWKWTDLAKSNLKSPKSLSTIKIESDQTNFGSPEVNSLAYNKHTCSIWAACGDSKTRSYDAASGKLTTVLEGHEDYVHQVVSRDANTAVTCGEDGQVLVWDVRTPRNPINRIIPSNLKELDRPHLGKFIRNVDVCGGEWIVCGGGPRAGVFHLRSGSLITSLLPEDEDSCTLVTAFVKENDASSIITAGENQVSICDLSGQITAKIPSSARYIYSVKVSHDKHMLMSVAGMGGAVDICRNLSYKHTSLPISRRE